MKSSRIMTRDRKRRGCCGSENSEDITDNYINDILKNKHMLEDICSYSGSTDISSRCTQYEKLTKQIEEYTWVQCDSVDCQKWRQIPKAVAEQLSDDSQWYCYMNEDKLYNNCAKPEEDYTAYDKLAKKLGYKYVMSKLTEGVLVWAKMHGYCRWPGIVTNDPISEHFVEIDIYNNPTHYHVEYLGTSHSHAWISASQVTLYGHREDTPKSLQISKLKVNKHKGRKKSLTVQNTTTCRKKYGKSLVDDAVQEAETMMLQSVEERLKKIKFIVKPKKMLGLEEIQIKTEPLDEFDEETIEKNKIKEAYKLSLAKTPTIMMKKSAVRTKADLKKQGSKVQPKAKRSLQKGSQVIQTVQKSLQQSSKVIKPKHRNMEDQKYQKLSVNNNNNASNLNSATKQVYQGINAGFKSFKNPMNQEGYTILSEGTLVLAKLDGYDKWPSVVTRDPQTGLHCEINYQDLASAYHVEFLGPSHSHAWIRADKICLYSNVSLSQLSGKSQTKNRFKKTLTSPKIVPSKALGLKLQKATQEAEKLVKMTEQERLICCIYRDVTDKEVLTDNTWYRDSGFESWNYPASSVSSAASSIEQFECSKLNYNSTLVDKSQEERFKIDVEMYKKNEKAFIHDLSRFMTRNNVHVRLTANWHHVPVGAFQFFLAVHERGGFHEVCRKKKWTSVFRELTETQFSAGPAPKSFYLRNIYPYELYVTGGDYESEIQKIQSKNRKKCMSDVMIEDDTGSFTNVDGASEESDDLTAILEDLEEYSSLCQLEEDVEASKKRMGINIAFHDDSPYKKVSPGLKLFSTPSEFNSLTGFPKREHEVPETMFSVSSAESQNELVFHQMQRIVDNDLL